jgi:hypothetical protein
VVGNGNKKTSYPASVFSFFQATSGVTCFVVKICAYTWFKCGKKLPQTLSITACFMGSKNSAKSPILD